jgi:tight adherence protein B
MSSTVLIVIIILCLAGMMVGVYFYAFGNSRSILGSTNYRSMGNSMQRNSTAVRHKDDKRASLFENSKEVNVKASNSSLTLEKRLKFAQSRMTPAVYRLCQIVISIAAFFIAGAKFNLFIQVLALSAGPLFMGWLINFFVNRRFNQFDIDYAPFILSLVGLLKTGMNVMSAIEAAAEGMEEGSLVKEEIELMMERLRFGVSEDKSIGSFGEDIYHPEIELFVQALLLSRRVGGTLSDTLDRLSRQVRRRQYFRKSAHAAIGMQRGSIWFIIAILVALEAYLYVINPDFVVGAWNHPLGWQVWQVGMCLIGFGIFWVRQITKLKV